jgi:hypothetical protein
MTTLELGGNISLSGFSDRDFTELIVIKKMVGQYARKMSDSLPGFSHLGLTLKDIHHSEGHGKVELIVKATVGGSEYASEVTGHNLFVVLDEALKKVLHQAQHASERHKPSF